MHDYEDVDLRGVGGVCYGSASQRSQLYITIPDSVVSVVSVVSVNAREALHQVDHSDSTIDQLRLDILWDAMAMKRSMREQYTPY